MPALLEPNLISCGCCSFGATADQHFDAKIAARDVSRYRKKGLLPTTRLLKDGIQEHARASGSVLDVGCGIGALTFELLDGGVKTAIAVDASSAYLSAAS